MKIKKFKSSTVKEALLMVKAELGPDAVILKTEKLKSSLFAKETYEVTAALDEASYAVPPVEKKAIDHNLLKKEIETYSPKKIKTGAMALNGNGLSDILGKIDQIRVDANIPEPAAQDLEPVAQASEPINQKVAPIINRVEPLVEKSPRKKEKLVAHTFQEESIISKNPINKTTLPNVPEKENFDNEDNGDNLDFSVLRDNVEEMRDAVYSLAEKASTEDVVEKLPKELLALENILKENEVSPKNVEDILNSLMANYSEEELLDGVKMRRALFVLLETVFRTSGEIRKKSKEAMKIAMVGPTGVGKTTSIAKLAAHYKLNKNMNVALIAADNYRIAAIEQIQSFANIASIPIEIVFNESEMTEALDKFKSYDFVFIDTAGRSQNNETHMSDLKRMMSVINPHETHLVMSMTTKASDLDMIAQKYSEVHYDKHLFTKLDETLSYGALYNVMQSTKKPISYITTGQNVPEDICIAKNKELANLVVGGGLL